MRLFESKLPLKIEEKRKNEHFGNCIENSGAPFQRQSQRIHTQQPKDKSVISTGSPYL